MEDDMRSKKIALVSHCILNQNAVVGGGAKYPSSIPNVLEILKEHEFSIMQLPCPEMYAAGLDRWGQVKEQYANSGFKRSFKNMAEFALDSVEDYVNHGYLIIVVGIEGSPSCGIKVTESNPSWGGTIDGLKKENVTLANARGAFMDVLFEEMITRRWKPFPSIGITFDTGESISSIKPFDDFLAMYD